MNAKVPPGLSQRRDERRGTSASRARGTWLSQKPVNTASTCAIRLGPRVADVEVRPEPVRDQALAGAIERAPAFAS